MRIAIVSDIHGNLTALEAVVADLRKTAPDVVFHGGDLAAPGSRPVEVVDRIRDLGWAGVLGNTDEMLTRPESLAQFAAQSKAPNSMWEVIGEMAKATSHALGPERLQWLASLPPVRTGETFAMVHASPGDCWRSPGADASDADLQKTYLPLGRPIVIYGHIHMPFVRTMTTVTVANSGSAGQPLDGDRRASYLLVDEKGATVRRVEYDVEAEIRVLRGCGLPHCEWLVRMLDGARPLLP